MIDKLLSSVPRYHGNGFFQVYLNDNQRLHVWHPDFPKPDENNAVVHDHVFNMNSRVLLGTVLNMSFEFYKSYPNEGRRYAQYEINQNIVRGHEEGEDWCQLLHYGTLHSIGHQFLSEGSTYMIPAGEFHASFAVGLTASIMTKMPTIKRPDHPSLLCVADEKPFQAFGEGTQYPNNIAWKAILDAIEVMTPANRKVIENALCRRKAVNNGI